MSLHLLSFPASDGYVPSPGRVLVTRLHTSRSRSLITTPPLIGMGPTRTGASGLRLQVFTGSTQTATVQSLHQPEEYTLPWVPRQEPIHDPSGCPHDLAGDLDHRHTERTELHPQQRTLLRPVLLRPTTLFG